MERYIALIRKDEGSAFGVEFPDVPGCFSGGDDLVEAKAMAAEALRAHLDLLAADGDPIPAPSGAAAVMARLAAEPGALDGFHSLTEIEAQAATSKAVRVNVTFDERLLARIDDAATTRRTTRSGYLAELARKDLASANLKAEPARRRRAERSGAP